MFPCTERRSRFRFYNKYPFFRDKKTVIPQIVPHIDWVCNDGHILSASVVNDIVSRMHMGGRSFDSETKASKEIITHKLAKMEELRFLYVKERRASFKK